MSRKRSALSLFLVMLTVILILSSTSLGLAQGPSDLSGDTDNTLEVSSNISVDAEKGIVPQLDAPNARTPEGEFEAVSIIVTFEDRIDVEAVKPISDGEIVYRYKHVFNGVSMIVDGQRLDEVAALDGVTGIYPDELLQLDTDASPEFIGATSAWSDLGGQGAAGEGVVVGVLDTGIWPEHPSFSDPDPLGNPYPAPSNGSLPCEFGNTAANPDDAPFTCNNKLIGAYRFMDTYDQFGPPLLAGEFVSARDDDGHGTHTASTAAGNGGVEASILGSDLGLVSGIAPRAHVIAYKVCGVEGCYTSDSAAAVDQAIADGVDVINFSIGGGSDPFNSISELAFLDAYKAGVFVATSAGNSGPSPDTVGHRGPWVTTVAASTHDRSFVATASLEADNGDTIVLDGVSITGGITADVVMAADYGDGLCLNPFPAGTFDGEIVVCERGEIARVSKSFNVAEGGAGGMILYNPVLQSLVADNHFIPSIHIQNDAGAALVDFMDTHTGVVGTLSGGMAAPAQGDVMAAFSSRGGPGQTLGVSKPDITAPGVQILAGHTPLPATEVGGAPGELFQAIAGTSMSSPHIAGAAALLRDMHPDWTPGQIKSALMTTALTDGVVKEDGVTPADPFDYGSGRVDLSQAGNPGLTISASGEEFEAHEADMWNANYPSLYIPDMPGIMSVQRTVHNEMGRSAFWRLYTDTPDDVDVKVSRRIHVPADGDATFTILIDASTVPLGEVRHASLHLRNGRHTVHFPITIVRGEPEISVAKSCEPTTIERLDTAECNITVTNNSFEETDFEVYDLTLGQPIFIVPHTVEGADWASWLWLKGSGTLAGAEPPNVNVAIDPSASPAGYLPIAGFGPVDAGATDESITNFSVPSFEFAGEVYSTIGVVSNGYIVIGGGTGADVDYINSDLPNPNAPNNIVAPFWTDLNPDAGGRVLVTLLTNGVDSWTVVEWEAVPNWGDGEPNTFQVWISYTRPDDISFVYGDVSDGDSGYLTVGAENKFGNSGGMVYFDGTGDAPTPSNTTGYEVDVFATPGEPGESHTITFDVIGRRLGEWTNCAHMTSPSFEGVNSACVSGEVVPR